jgi:hypothetical protein
MTLKLKTVVRHPARVVGGEGVEVTTENGVVTLDLVMSEFAEVLAVDDQDATSVVLVAPGATADDPDVYSRLPISGLAEAVPFTVEAGSLDYDRIQDVSASRVLGSVAGSAPPEELTLSQVLDFIGSAAQGDFLYRGAAGWARLAAGTSGYFLKTLGAGANPAWDAVSGGGDILAANNASDFANTTTARINLNAVLYGQLYGLTTSNNSGDPNNDIDIAVGEAASDHSSAPVLMRLTSAITKRIDAAWAVGTNQGGLDGSETVVGTPDVSTWYFLWLIKRVDTGVVDVLFSESATAPTMPANYTHKRLIGAVYNNASGNIVSFVQIGNFFLWGAVIEDYNSYAIGTSTTTFQLSVPPLVGVEARIHALSINAGGQAIIKLASTLHTNAYGNVVSQVAAVYGSETLDLFSDGLGQITGTGSHANDLLFIRTIGYRFPL